MDRNALLIVRAVVAAEADRLPFDAWYETEPLPEAAAAFGAEPAWRAWSRSEPSVHYAFYEFGDADAAVALRSDAMKSSSRSSTMPGTTV